MTLNRLSSALLACGVTLIWASGASATDFSAAGKCSFAKRPPVVLKDKQIEGFCKFDHDTQLFGGTPAEQARWTISLQQAPPTEKAGEVSPPQKSGGVQTIQSVKTGPVKQDLIVYESGAKSEIWYFQNHVLSANSTNPTRVIVQNLSTLNDPMDSQGVFRELGHPVRSAGYPGFDWLDLRHYQGVTYFNKTLPTYHYTLRGKDPETGAAIVAAEAWIHAGTGAPVAYRTGGNVYIYTFGEPPAETLTLPPNFAAAQTRLQRSLDRQRRLESDASAQR